MSRKPYVRKISPTWWLSRGFYTNYMVRELTCIFIGIYSLILVKGISALSKGPEAWNAFLAGLHSGGSVLFHAIALFFAVYHSVTWFAVTPKAMEVHLGEEKLSGGAIIAGHYAAWAAVSVVIVVLAGW